jgi:restriction system protein
VIKYWWLLIPLAALIGYAAKSYRIYRFQNLGEVLVRHALTKHLPANSWHLLNNITLQFEGGTTQIDHVLVSRYGVFVVETKHYKGWLFGDDRSKQWTQVVWGWKYRFKNPLHQNYKHLKAVQAALDFLPPEQITGLVVFTGEAIFKTKQPTNVYNLNSLLSYLQSMNQELLTENRMQFCVGRLECLRLALTRETDIEHRANLEAKHRSR